MTYVIIPSQCRTCIEIQNVDIEYYHVEDIVGLTDVHKAALQTTESVTTPVFTENFNNLIQDAILYVN